MMSCTLPSPDMHNFCTLVWRDSTVLPGVRFAIRSMTLAQRIELTKRVRELTLKNDFLRSGTPCDRLDEALGELLARRVYLEWGLSKVEGLRIDDKDANPEMLIEQGPEKLADEAARLIVNELHLNEEETKNS